MKSQDTLMETLAEEPFNRLKTYHINAEFEPELCALGIFCVGTHEPSLRRLQDRIDGARSLKPDSVAGYDEDVRFIAPSIRMAGIRDELHSVLLDFYVKIYAHFPYEVKYVVRNLAIKALRAQTSKMHKNEILGDIDPDGDLFPDDRDRIFATLVNNGILKRIQNQDGSYPNTGPDYELEMVMVVRVESYIRYLSSLEILDDEIRENAL